ncbi:S8 family peptidase [Halobacteriovorax sp. HLS]|uniref:S8 family peptidase n=1 Tax=Halobacteriovorax sp. HLS TaxID=2234000 RepID=UPI000FDC2FBA|nr:S8 family peptidase [Halobacteriovorax sp. HLS]
MLKKCLVTMTLLVGFSSVAQDLRFHQNRLIVKVNEGASLPHSELIESAKHFFKNTYIVRTQNLSQLERELKTDTSIASVNRDYYANREALPAAVDTEKVAPGFNKMSTSFNDPALRKLWAFKSPQEGGMGVLNAYENYDPSHSSEVIVAVVDTGVDYNHEDLKDVMWTNPGEIPGNGIDDDQNGYIDDIHGINTLVRDADGNATMDISDGHSHGTHVSGTIAAKQNNGVGIAGVASNVKIMGIRTVPNSSDETDVDVAEAFLYAAKNGARIINCSFGKSHNEGGMLVKDTIDHIGSEYGVLVVAAAGNSTQNIDTKLTYPASFESESLLVVASTSKWKRLSMFSNYGKKNVDVAAPGSGIYSTTPGNRYSNMSGTSMASPNTAGVAAELLSRNPNLNVYELKELLMRSVFKSRSYASKTSTGGLVDLGRAVTE